MDVGGSGDDFVPRRYVVDVEGTCGLSEGDLVVQPMGLDGFFRYEGTGMGGESQK